MLLITAAITVIGGGALMLFKHALDRAAEAEYKKRVLNTFKQPPKLSAFLEEDLVPRPDVEKKLSDVMTTTDSYFLISGGYGVGKTTAVQSSLHKLGKKGGCVYVAVNYAKPEMILNQLDAAFTPTPKTGSKRPIIETKVVDSKLVNTQDWHFSNSLTNNFIEVSVMEEILAGAKEYRKEFKKRPILVIDDINYLAKDCPEILSQLLSWAKRCADERALGIVFVSFANLQLQMTAKNPEWKSF